MRRGLLFKTKRIAEELNSVYPPMRDRLILLADMVNRDYQKPLTVTCLTRTLEENQKAGGKTDSLHMASPVRAADIRITTWVGGKAQPLYTRDEIAGILIFWRKGGAKFGGQEERDHLHLQVKR